MKHFRTNKNRRRGLIGLIGVSALLITACQPGWISPLAGTGQSGSTGDGGPALSATFESPGAIVSEHSTGAYYVVDSGACEIRKVAPDATITTVVGNGTCGYSGDGGPATDAQIDPGVGGLAEDAAGDLYLADTLNGALREITADGTITTIQTTPAVTGFGVMGVAVTTTGAVYMAAGYAGLVRVSPDYAQIPVPTLGGPPSAVSVTADPAGGLLIGTGSSAQILHLDDGSTTPTTIASFPEDITPTTLTADASGHVYAGMVIALSGITPITGYTLRIDPDGTYDTIAGTGATDPGTERFWGNGLARPLSANGLAVTDNNGLLISSGHVVYRLDHPAGVAPLAKFGAPSTLLSDKSTDAYFVVDQCKVDKVSGDTITTVAGTGTCGYSGDGGPATAAEINPYVGSLAQGATGDLYLADSYNGRIRRIAADGTITTVASGLPTDQENGDIAIGIAVTTADTLYVSLGNSGLVRIDVDGSVTQVLSAPVLGIAADPTGGLFIVDQDQVTIAHLDEGSTIPTTVATLPSASPFPVVDGSGHIYFASTFTIMRMDPDGTTTTIAGNGQLDPSAVVDGLLPGFPFGPYYGDPLAVGIMPFGLATTANGDLLFTSVHRVYRLDNPASANPKVELAY